MKIKKRIFIIIGINVLLMILFTILPFKKMVTVDNLEGDIYFSVPMEKDKEYIQKFKSPVDNLEEISIKFSTFLEENYDGKILFMLTDENNNIISKQVISIEDFIDNEYHAFKFEKIPNSKNKVYNILIKYDYYVDGNTLGYWFFVGNNYKFNLNGEEQVYTLNIHFLGYENDYFVVWYPLVIILVCITILTIINGDEDDEKRKK